MLDPPEEDLQTLSLLQASNSALYTHTRKKSDYCLSFKFCTTTSSGRKIEESKVFRFVINTLAPLLSPSETFPWKN